MDFQIGIFEKKARLKVEAFYIKVKNYFHLIRKYFTLLMDYYLKAHIKERNSKITFLGSYLYPVRNTAPLLCSPAIAGLHSK